MFQKNTNILAFVFLLGVVNIVFSPFLTNFGYIDEGLVVVLLGCCLKYAPLFCRYKEFVAFVVIMCAFLGYSLFMAVNVPQATMRDFLICLKPFVCFYVCYTFGFRFSSQTKKICRLFFILFGLYLWGILPYINSLYRNTTAYYPACVFVGVGYLIFSEKRRLDWILASFFILPGVASIRAKFFAEIIVWTGIVFFVKGRVKINIKYLLVAGALLLAVYKINQDKILMYFVHGLRDGQARTYLYSTAIDIFRDFFPFGPGFGTFATDSAAKFYSPLNYTYHLNSVWGLSTIDFSKGINYYSDTFYPILAQFGVVGTAFFVLFWRKRWLESHLIGNISQYKIFLFMFFYLAIQCVAENTFTGSSSVPIMMVIGMCLSPKSDVFIGGATNAISLNSKISG